MWGLGFAVQGFKVWGVGFRVHVWGVGFKLSDLGGLDLGLGLEVQGLWLTGGFSE